METTDEVFAYESDKVTPFIYKTSNLEQFNNYEFNRDLDMAHVKKLGEKIKDFTLCPLLCTYDKGLLYILDGQHRLEVAKYKSETLYYRIIHNICPTDIAELQSKKNWNPTNWVKFWAYHQKPNYIRLLELHHKYGLTIGTIASLLTTQLAYADTFGLQQSNNTSTCLVRGEFEIKNEDFALKILEQVKDFNTTIKTQTKFVKALIMANTAYKSNYSEYDHTIMQKRITQFPEKFEKKASTIDYLRMIEDILNIGVSQQNRFRFF